jgi:hypothetical protein
MLNDKARLWVPIVSVHIAERDGSAQSWRMDGTGNYSNGLVGEYDPLPENRRLLTFEE